LSSNNGRDFGTVINEMAKAGAHLQEYALLDAQHFGVPQRRRRVFLVSCFDSATADRCPDPLLPVRKSLPGDTKKGKSKRKESSSQVAESFGGDGQWAAGTTEDGDILRTSVTSKWHKGSGGPSGSEYYNMVVEGFTPSSFANYTEGVGTLRSNGGDLGGGSETLIAEPFVKSRRAQSTTDDETWVEGEVNPTLNSFDVGDTRSTTVVVGSLQARDHKGVNHEGARDGKLIIEQSTYAFDSLSSNSMKSSNPDSGCNEVDVAKTLDTWRPDPSLNQGGIAIVEEPMLIDGTRVDDVRVYEPPVQTLKERMGTGGNNVPMLAFDTQFGSNANVFEDQSPTLKASQQSPSVAYPIDTRNALRDPEKHDAQNRQGLGIGNDGDPMATLTSTHVNAVVYGITGNAIGRQDHNGPNGPSHTPENGPMFTLTSTDIHAVAYDEYNDSINKVHHALRAGTKQSTGVLLENDVVGTLRSGGCGGVPSSRGEHIVAEPTMAVRRLTPLECERLMGWPDDHTRFKADGTEQADTHRYKQCGNGVASPVARWVAEHIGMVEHGKG
jgi:site-specific DNA-cytosine methylase